MNMTFLEYSAAMMGCYATMPVREREELHAWEAKFVDGSGAFGTSDWPGWEKYIGKFEPPSRREKDQDKFGYIYLIRASTGHHKIGSSRSVQARLKQLQCANPQPLVLLHQFPSANAQRDESALHDQYSHRRVGNEWFALTESDVARIVSISGQDDG